MAEHEAEKILQIEDLHTYYGRSHIIQGLSMDVNRLEAVSILGRNGVGKTTTLRSILGLTPPRKGRIRINGEDTTRWPPHRVVRKGIGYVPAERHIFPGVSVEENLKLAANPSGEAEAWSMEKVYSHFPVLKTRHRQDGSTLSGGEQQMLAIGRALMGNPVIMLLDEPSQGLAPLLVYEVIQPILLFCLESGLTLLLVEQNYRMALKVASRHYLMGIKGKVAQTATSDQLMADQDIIKQHLAV
ncbi:MAG: ABC transporter ATP-binding protein [Desulfobacteraceae bacterium]